MFIIITIKKFKKNRKQILVNCCMGFAFRRNYTNLEIKQTKFRSDKSTFKHLKFKHSTQYTSGNFSFKNLFSTYQRWILLPEINESKEDLTGENIKDQPGPRTELWNE